MDVIGGRFELSQIQAHVVLLRERRLRAAPPSGKRKHVSIQ
jgi:hypothetical protein